jgi:hypothetical protein
VRVSNEPSRGSSRLSMHEFDYVVFGAMTADWGPQPEISLAAAIFFKSLSYNQFLDASWARIIAEVSGRLLASEGEERRDAISLVIFGTRKAQNLLATRQFRPPPFFGLLDPFVCWRIFTLNPFTSTSTNIDMMRFIAESLRL